MIFKYKDNEIILIPSVSNPEKQSPVGTKVRGSFSSYLVDVPAENSVSSSRVSRGKLLYRKSTW